MNRSQGVFGFLIICMIVGSALLARPAASNGVPNIFVPAANNTSTSPTQGVAEVAATPSATLTIPTPTTSIVATVDPSIPQGESFNAAELPGNVQGESQSPLLAGTEAGWNPPPMEVPIARHPWDHYWFIRPVAPDNNNFALPDYSFGSNGNADDFRIHHGVDIANPIGTEVFAAADGVVIWSGKGSVEEDGYITAYGETIVIQHDIGTDDGESIYTLYAHLSKRLAETIGERVESHQVIGLIGNTGQVTGPHVHFEVRIGRNRYNNVYNPLLWMAPYDGTGVVAGRLLFSDGSPAIDANIIVINQATGEVVFRTSSYAGDELQGIHADENWQETFVIPDLPEGSYLITAQQEYGQWSGAVSVVAGMTNWVDMQRNLPEDSNSSGQNETEEP